MNALVRRNAPGRAGATSLATAANDRLLSPAAIEALAPNAAQTASTISAVVVSSQLIANRASSRRRLMPRASARATMRVRLRAGIDRDRVKVLRARNGPAAVLKSARQGRGCVRHTRSDLTQPVRPVIDAVHRRDDRRQHLRGADV